MLTVYAAVIGLAVAVVAALLGAASLVIHWVKRDQHPDVTALHVRCDQLQLGQADIIDRIDHWTRRDRTRRLREGANPVEEIQPLPPPDDDKAALRQIARAKGFRV